MHSFSPQLIVRAQDEERSYETFWAEMESLVLKLYEIEVSGVPLPLGAPLPLPKGLR